MSLPRPCLECGELTRNTSGRCHRHATTTARGYGAAWQRLARQVLEAWRAEHGDLCPGWHRDPHPATDLVVDHVVARTLEHGVGVLCRPCNTLKSNTS